MKTLLLIALLALPAFSRDVVVLSPTEVHVDGGNFGSVADCIANNPKLTGDIQRALQKWDAERSATLAGQQAAAAKAKEDAEKVASHALAALREKKAKEEASGKGKKWEALDELEGVLNVTAKDIRKAEAKARFDEAKRALEDASK